MVRSSYLCLVFCALAILYASEVNAKKSRCEVTHKDAHSGHDQTYVDDGHDTFEIEGPKCSFKGQTPTGGALVCFLYSALVIMPVMYYFSVHKDLSDYTWAFLGNFMPIFIGILMWSCFDESFERLDLGWKFGVMVVTRNILVPVLIIQFAESPNLFGYADVLKYAISFMALHTGTAALKYGGGDGPPGIKLVFICILFVVWNAALWKLKNLCLKLFFSDQRRYAAIDRIEAVFTELNLDSTAFSFAAMVFLTTNALYFKRSELLRKEAYLGMANEHLFDTAKEGAFAAVYSLIMFGTTVAMETLGGKEHRHPRQELETNKVAKWFRSSVTLNGRKVDAKANAQKVCVWEKVVVKSLTGDQRAGTATVDLVNASVLDNQEANSKDLTANQADLRCFQAEEMEDYVWHLLQLGMMASSAWSGVLALNFLIRKHLFPSLLKKHFEGSLFVSIVLLFICGLVVLGLATHSNWHVQKRASGKESGTLVSTPVLRYFRIYFLRAVSLMAALSWDMTLDEAYKALPVRSIEAALGFEPGGISDTSAKFFLVSKLFCIATVYVNAMYPTIARANALLEYHEHDNADHEWEE